MVTPIQSISPYESSVVLLYYRVFGCCRQTVVVSERAYHCIFGNLYTTDGKFYVGNYYPNDPYEIDTDGVDPDWCCMNWCPWYYKNELWCTPSKITPV